MAPRGVPIRPDAAATFHPKRFAKYRAARGYTQARLAEALGCTQARIGQIESGERLPTRKFWTDVQRVFPKLDPGQFYTDSDGVA